jgi:hypothetical protein
VLAVVNGLLERLGVIPGRAGWVGVCLECPGPHLCLGVNMARRELTAMFRELFARASAIHATGEPTLLLSNFDNGITHLPYELREPDRARGAGGGETRKRHHPPAARALYAPDRPHGLVGRSS